MPRYSTLLAGILFTLAAGCTFAVQDSIGKTLTGLVPLVQVLWGRYVFQTTIMATALSATRGTAFLRTSHPVLQILRGLCLLSATSLMYAALAYVPLADATAVIFFGPILVTVFSVIFLKERIGVHRIGAVAAGFAGMLVIIRPGLASIEPRLFLVVLAAVFNACYFLLTRRLSGREDSASTMFNTSAPGAVVLSAIALPTWETPSPTAVALMVAIGCTGSLAHFLLVRGFAYAPASLLSPFLYIQVLAASILTVVVFGDPLHLTTAVGALILVGSGLYIWWRENR
ncbi:DMT family transporter [Jiella sonneratiae]|uniref:DMT family transporter n=1 Tax=Jiella sonneratiae TaxID=2816856 RepID=A0ABS3J7D7_9HYPH|nr:DMT family transporter [Jiella sonneratiae]MBO0905581.1 DMT family transporter [Jiella sonneratiae]